MNKSLKRILIMMGLEESVMLMTMIQVSVSVRIEEQLLSDVSCQV